MQLSCLLMVFGIGSGLFFQLSMPPKLQITACDVGQGDAVLMQYGQSSILIDTGPNSSILRCLQAKLSPFDPVIDLVVLTHPDKDHVGGLESVEKHYAVTSIWTNGQSKNPTPRNAPVFIPNLGDLVRYPGLAMSVVWSGEITDLWNSAVIPEEETNARSLGTFFASESFGFLSLGDLECEQELAVTMFPLLNDPTILKISHHGSKSSSCLEFLEKIHPETGVISVGEKNSYNHPEENVISNLEKTGIVVYRTDYQGKITFLPTSFGKLFVSPERK